MIACPAFLQNTSPSISSRKPTIIVENMPGAGSIIAANHIYNIAKPDGLTIGTLNQGLPFAQLLNAEGRKFDLMKYSWIGSTSVEATVFCIRSDLPYKNFDDLRKAKEPINLSSSGPSASNHQYSILLKEFLGLNLNLVIYPSTAAGMLAIERKEVDGRAGFYSLLKTFIERGLVRPVIRCGYPSRGLRICPWMKNLPRIIWARRLWQCVRGRMRLAVPYVAPPGTPPEVIDILRDAFAKAAKDLELNEEAKKEMMGIKYLSAN